MLKPVVQQVDRRAELALGEPARRDSGRRRRAPATPGSARASISGSSPAARRRRRTRVPSVTTVTPSRAPAPAVAAGEDRRTLAALEQQPRDVARRPASCRCRRREVADADDRARQPPPPRRVARVPPPPPRPPTAPYIELSDAESMDQAEGTDARRRRLAPAGGSSSAMTASVLSLAPRLASTSARAAAPSRARRTGSVDQRSAAPPRARARTAPARPRRWRGTRRQSP